MCQQWFSVAGLIADIIGFILIAREWFWAISLQGGERVRQIGELAERRRARAEGRARTAYEEDEDNPSLPRHMWDGWMHERGLRVSLFWWGIGLVVLGFAGQLIGSLPYATTVFGLASCS